MSNGGKTAFCSGGRTDRKEHITAKIETRQFNRTAALSKTVTRRALEKMCDIIYGLETKGARAEIL